MADKTSLGGAHTAPDPASVTTSGTAGAGTVKITWDDADTKAEILEAFEIARIQMMDYLNRRLT